MLENTGNPYAMVDSSNIVYDLTKFNIIYDQILILQLLLGLSIIVGVIGSIRAISKFLK